jgi:hypothetical protein
MEPNFAKRGTRAFVCGSLSGALVMREKGWLAIKKQRYTLVKVLSGKFVGEGDVLLGLTIL